MNVLVSVIDTVTSKNTDLSVIDTVTSKNTDLSVIGTITSKKTDISSWITLYLLYFSCVLIFVQVWYGMILCVYWMTLLAAQSRVIVRSALRVISAHCRVFGCCEHGTWHVRVSLWQRVAYSLRLTWELNLEEEQYGHTQRSVICKVSFLLTETRSSCALLSSWRGANVTNMTCACACSGTVAVLSEFCGTWCVLWTKCLKWTRIKEVPLVRVSLCLMCDITERISI
jgi:lysylphosphatidylglycerol synthetase-like protein (DUF2156 family)